MEPRGTIEEELREQEERFGEQLRQKTVRLSRCRRYGYTDIRNEILRE